MSGEFVFTLSDGSPPHRGQLVSFGYQSSWPPVYICSLALSFSAKQSQARRDSFPMMRVFVSDFETRTRHYPCQKTCGWIWTDFDIWIWRNIKFDSCCWLFAPMPTVKHWAWVGEGLEGIPRREDQGLGRWIPPWVVRGGSDHQTRTRCGPTFEAPDRPMQLRFPQTYRFPAFSYYPGTISVAKRILNLNCPLNFWVSDSFEAKIREMVELSIFSHFPIHVEFGRPSGLYLASSQVPTGGNLFIQSHCKVWSDYSTFRTWIVLQVHLYLGTVAING